MADDVLVSIADLEQRLRKAMAEEDFEACARLRDELTDLREIHGIPPRADSPDAPTSTNLRRQEPGKMGLGTDQPSHRPGGAWKPPQRPDLMTSNTKPRRGPRR